MIPGIGAFCALIVKRVLGTVGFGQEDQPYSSELLANLTDKGNLFAEGVFVLEQGWLYASILLCGFMVALIERHFSNAIGWLVASAGLSALGIIHSFKIMSGDITTSIAPAWDWTFGYLAAAGILVAVKFAMTCNTEGENS